MAAPERQQQPATWRVNAAVLLLVALALPSPASPVAAADSVKADAAEADTFISDTERFPGWKGTLPGVKYGSDGVTSGDPNRARRMAHGSLGEVEWDGEVEQLSWAPRLFLYKKFLSDAECDHLIDKARAHLEKSEVVDNDTGEGKPDSVRTSSGAFFGVGEDPVIQHIEERIARISFLPVENGEGLQVLRYEIGEEYKPHHDFFWDKVNADPAHGGQRIATFLMYLTTPEEGGETVFPQGRPATSGPGWSDCAKEGLSVKSRRGDAVLFYALHPNGTTDLHSEHGSCPTLKGVKWSSTKWLHVSSLVDGAAAGSDADADASCIDSEKGCEDWAWADECENNPGFMLLKCKKSCRVCNKAPADLQALISQKTAAGKEKAAKQAAEQEAQQQERDTNAQQRRDLGANELKLSCVPAYCLLIVCEEPHQQGQHMRTCDDFAPKLLVRDVYACDIAEWQTEDTATFTFGDTLRFTRVWIQGHVGRTKPDSTFSVDDGTGSIEVAPTALPATVPKPDVRPGDYVVVIGRLLPGDPEAPSPDNYTVRAQKVRVLSTPGAGPAWRKEVESIHAQVYATM